MKTPKKKWAMNREAFEATLLLLGFFPENVSGDGSFDISHMRGRALASHDPAKQARVGSAWVRSAYVLDVKHRSGGIDFMMVKMGRDAVTLMFYRTNSTAIAPKVEKNLRFYQAKHRILNLLYPPEA